jgi:hypothetical protein
MAVEAEREIDVRALTEGEAREVLDRQARRYLDMSGEDFVAAWDAGRFRHDDDRPEVVRVAMLLPLGR